jgi:Na+-transporting NADH:ubiquinone oxidoreductase subunit C
MKDSALYPILFMALLAAVFAALVSSLAAATQSRVEAGEQERLRGHVFSALGLDAPTEPEAREQFWAERVKQQTAPDGLDYFIGRDETGQPTGYALPFRSPGFWGPIDGYLGVDETGDRILGIAFTQQQETPGLGGRIVEEWFRNQFRGKPIDTEVAVPLDFVFRKPVTKREVEAITGATETSTRLGRHLNTFLTELEHHPALRTGPGNGEATP